MSNDLASMRTSTLRKKHEALMVKYQNAGGGAKRRRILSEIEEIEKELKDREKIEGV